MNSPLDFRAAQAAFDCCYVARSYRGLSQPTGNSRAVPAFNLATVDSGGVLFTCRLTSKEAKGARHYCHEQEIPHRTLSLWTPAPSVSVGIQFRRCSLQKYG